MRAWGTIYIAQSQGLEFAEGFDHIFYGWVFFAIVLAALLAIGWRWFERWPDDPYIDAQAIETDDFAFHCHFVAEKVVCRLDVFQHPVVARLGYDGEAARQVL